jgi:hypothetical protein
MLSIEECRKLLHNTELTDDEVQKLRDSMYDLVSSMIEDYNDKKKSKNREQKKEG